MPEPAADQLHVTVDQYAQINDQQAVLAWRERPLVEPGFTEADATLLASCSHVDTHDAARLLERSCSPGLATRMLR